MSECILLGFGWIICSAISYKLMLHFFQRDFSSENNSAHLNKDRSVSIVLSIWGPISLIAIIICYLLQAREVRP